MEGDNSGFNAVVDGPVQKKEISYREPRGGVRRELSNSSVASISSVASSPLTGGQHSAFSSKSQVNRVKRASDDTQGSTGHRLVRAIQRDLVSTLTAFRNL